MTTPEEMVEPRTAAACWRALTLLAEAVRGHGAPIRRCSLLIGDAPAVCLDSLTPPAGDGWRVSLVLDGESASNGPPAGTGESRYRLDDLIVLRRLTDGTLPSDAAALFEIYLPYCMAPVHARRVRRSFTVSVILRSRSMTGSPPTSATPGGSAAPRTWCMPTECVPSATAS